MWRPQDSVQLVYNSNFTMVYGITIVTGANLNQLISWGPHIVGLWHHWIGFLVRIEGGNILVFTVRNLRWFPVNRPSN